MGLGGPIMIIIIGVTLKVRVTPMIMMMINPPSPMDCIAS